MPSTSTIDVKFASLLFNSYDQHRFSTYNIHGPWMDIVRGGARRPFLNNLFFSDVNATRIYLFLHFLCMAHYERFFVTIVTVYEIFW